MKLPVMLAQYTGQRVDCHNCTTCCRDLVVHLTPEDRTRIDRQGWGDRLSRPPYVRLGRGYVLNHGADGACVFLQDDGLCRIHAEHGTNEKPLACRMYPFSLDAGADAWWASVRFDCPSAAANRGRLASNHESALKRMAAEWESTGAAATSSPPIRLTASRDLTERELARFLEQVDRWLKTTGISIEQRLVGLNDLLATLAAAKLDKVRDERFEELIGMLVDDLPRALADYRKQPSSDPAGGQLRLFRQAVFGISEHVTFEEAMAGRWAHIAGRMQQLGRSRRMRRGNGPLPRLAGRTPRATFAELEALHRAADTTADSVDELVTRYVRGRLAARSAFGAGYYGWTVIEGLQSLVLSIAAAGWLARFVGLHDGAPSFNAGHVATALGIVDRTAGRSPGLGGASARLRLRYLAADGGLARLACRYAVGAGINKLGGENSSLLPAP